MQIKYLCDGRKVAIVGQINSTEYIVQEIFVTADGDEIPSGEKFTTKSLHEKPMESWWIKEKRNLEQDVINLRNIIKNLNDSIVKFKATKAASECLISEVLAISKKYNHEALNQLFMFLDGRANWVLEIPHYSLKAPKPFLDKISCKDEYGRFESLRLISILGDSQGDLCFKLNQYSDGYGGNPNTIEIFETYDLASNRLNEIVKARLQDSNYDAIQVKNLIDEGFVLSKENDDLFKKALEKNLQKKINYQKKQIEEHNIEISKIENEIRGIYAN